VQKEIKSIDIERQSL